MKQTIYAPMRCKVNNITPFYRDGKQFFKVSLDTELVKEELQILSGMIEDDHVTLKW